MHRFVRRGRVWTFEAHLAHHFYIKSFLPHRVQIVPHGPGAPCFLPIDNNSDIWISFVHELKDLSVGKAIGFVYCEEQCARQEIGTTTLRNIEDDVRWGVAELILNVCTMQSKRTHDACMATWLCMNKAIPIIKSNPHAHCSSKEHTAPNNIPHDSNQSLQVAGIGSLVGHKLWQCMIDIQLHNTATKCTTLETTLTNLFVSPRTDKHTWPFAAYSVHCCI